MGREQFLRTEMLLGEDGLNRLAESHVILFGLGGVGSWCAEALCRAGVGKLTLVDQDVVSLSNLNRQLQASHSTIGKGKGECLAARFRDINPDGIFIPRQERYSGENREQFFPGDYDYVVDAIDLVSCKLDLIETCVHLGTPMVSALGTGNKLDASQFSITDISKTQGCALARIVRKELRKRGILHHKVVCSPELPLSPEQRETPPPGRRSVPASAPWVPPVAGFLLAQCVILDLVGKNIGDA